MIKLKSVHRIYLEDRIHLSDNETVKKLTELDYRITPKNPNYCAGTFVKAPEQFEQLKKGFPDLKVVSISERAYAITLYVKI